MPAQSTCSCPAPIVVDLTEAYNTKHGHGGKKEANSFSSQSTRKQQQPTSTTILCQEQLLNNLQRFGWAHVSLRRSDIPPTSPLLYGGCHDLWNHPSGNPKQAIAELFQPDFLSKHPFPNAIYRTAESGSPGEATVEPKQSWETRRCRSYDTQPTSTTVVVDDDKDQRLLLKDITHAFHSVVTTVNWVLRLPDNLLVQEQTNSEEEPVYCSCGCSSPVTKQPHQQPQQTPAPQSPCNVDLLRLFYYDQVPPPTHNEQQQLHQSILGSSSHTDWGAFTVVWQDQVGGLQTWCPACDVWRNVEASFDDDTGNNNKDDGMLRFVIHVGDVTSLALAHAAQQQQRDQPAFSGWLQTYRHLYISRTFWPIYCK